MVIAKLKDIARQEDVSVFGTAPASAMMDEPAGHRPDDFIPDAQSLVCFGIPVPRHVYRSPKYNLETAWRSQNLLYRRLDTLALRFSALLEETGATAMPIYGCMPMEISQRGLVGYINQLRMAEETGIGVIGKNGLLIHSQYGSRLMLGGVVTSAPLPVMRYPDTDEPGCPTDCRICADACPVDAIMPERKKVKTGRCIRYTADTPSMSKLKLLLLSARNKSAAASYMSRTAFDEHTFHQCSKCVALCPYGEN